MSLSLEYQATSSYPKIKVYIPKHTHTFYTTVNDEKEDMMLWWALHGEPFNSEEKGFSIKPQAPAKSSCYRAIWREQHSWIGKVCGSFPNTETGQGMLACQQRTLTSASSTAMRSKIVVTSGPSTDSELTSSDLKDFSSQIPVSWHQHRYEITKGKVAAMTILSSSCWASNLGAKTSTFYKRRYIHSIRAVKSGLKSTNRHENGLKLCVLSLNKEKSGKYLNLEEKQYYSALQ